MESRDVPGSILAIESPADIFGDVPRRPLSLEADSARDVWFLNDRKEDGRTLITSGGNTSSTEPPSNSNDPRTPDESAPPSSVKSAIDVGLDAVTTMPILWDPARSLSKKAEWPEGTPFGQSAPDAKGTAITPPPERPVDNGDTTSVPPRSESIGGGGFDPGLIVLNGSGGGSGGGSGSGSGPGSAQVNLTVEGVGDPIEDTIGGFISLNDDYDEWNLSIVPGQFVPDNQPSYIGGHKIVAGDSELRNAQFEMVGPGGPATYQFIFSDKIKLWRVDGANSFTQLTSGTQYPTTLPVWNDELDLIVEGMSGSGSQGDILLTGALTVGGTSYFDDVKLTVVDVDFDIDGLSEQFEENGNGAVLLNDNYDEGNQNAAGEPVPDDEMDHTAGHRITLEDTDLKSAQLTIQAPGVKGNWRLEFPEKIKMWKVENGTATEITSHKQSAEVTLDQTIDLRIEGMQYSTTLNDVEVRAVFRPTDAITDLDDRAKLTVIEMGFVDAGKFRTQQLKVAKWQGSYNEVPQPGGTTTYELKDEFINQDPDRFTVWVGAPMLNTDPDTVEAVGVKLSTDSPDIDYDGDDTDHDDDPTMIQLIETGVNTGIFYGEWQMLVGDEIDDGDPGDGGIPVTANILDDDQDQTLNDAHGDRTHIVGVGRETEGELMLGSKVKAELTLGGQTFTVTSRVRTEKIIANSKFYILRDKPEVDGGEPVTTKAEVRADIGWANERLAQVGVYIDIDPDNDIEIVDPPDGVDLTDKFTFVDAEGKLTAEFKALFDELNRTTPRGK